MAGAYRYRTHAGAPGRFYAERCVLEHHAGVGWYADTPRCFQKYRGLRFTRQAFVAAHFCQPIVAP